MTDPIGYRRPPRHSRWIKGQSGNPRGRVRGSRNFKTELASELREVIQVKEGGTPKRMSKQRALVKALVTRAIQGESGAMAHLLKLIQQLEQVDRTGTKSVGSEDQKLIENYLKRVRGELR